MSSKVPRRVSDLEQELKDQIELLKLDAVNFDAGKEIVAKGLAVKLRILLHDTPHSKSLLGQLGKKNAQFCDTAQEFYPNNPLAYSGLIVIHQNDQGEAKFVPPLDTLPQGNVRYLEFDAWWNATVFRDNEEEMFSRKDLILALANQDGGAHVDVQLDEKYVKLSAQNSLGWQSRVPGGKWHPLTNPHFAAVRQIAHETLKSIEPGYVGPKVGFPPGIAIGGMKIEVVPGKAESHSAIAQLGQRKIGRNDPCSCGSGKKYKKCHGKG